MDIFRLGESIKNKALKSYRKDILGYIFVIVAVAIFLWGNRVVEIYKTKCLASLAWPTVDGKIIESKLEEKVSEDDNGNKGYSYLVKISYEYLVKDNRFISDRIGWDEKGNRQSMKNAQLLMNSYSKGKTVVVHYDPENPEFSLLDATLPEELDGAFGYMDWGGVFYFVASGVFASLAVAMFLTHFSMWHKLHSAIYFLLGICLLGIPIIISIYNVRYIFLSGFGIGVLLMGFYVYEYVEWHPQDKADLSGWE